MRAYRVVEDAEVISILELLLDFANQDIKFAPSNPTLFEKQWNILIDKSKKLLEDLNG